MKKILFVGGLCCSLFISSSIYAKANVLHWAALYNDKNLAEFIFKEIKDGQLDSDIVNEQDEAGNTPLHIAGKLRDRIIFNRLIANGAQVGIENEKSQKPYFASHLERAYWKITLFFRKFA